MYGGYCPGRDGVVLVLESVGKLFASSVMYYDVDTSIVL
jgi:hypothetical protein